MNLQKEDIDNMDRILEMYVQDKISNFIALNISKLLSIEYSYAQFLIAEIRALNYDRSFLRVDDTVRSGNLRPLNNDKFLIRRFMEDGGCKKHFEENENSSENESLSRKIDDIVSTQIMLLKGQLELSEEGKQRVSELKELLIPIVLNKTPWTDLVKGQVLSAIIGIGINSENAISLLESIGKSI